MKVPLLSVILIIAISLMSVVMMNPTAFSLTRLKTPRVADALGSCLCLCSS